jgi:hypothetical protein
MHSGGCTCGQHAGNACVLDEGTTIHSLDSVVLFNYFLLRDKAAQETAQSRAL